MIWDRLYGATQQIISNNMTTFVNASYAATSDIGQGWADIGNGVLQSVVAVGAAVGAAAQFASGNEFGAIVGGASAINAAEKAYGDFSSQAAHDAWNDTFNSIDHWFGTDDGDWQAIWQGDVLRGVPGAAHVYSMLFPTAASPASLASHLTAPHAETAFELSFHRF